MRSSSIICIVTMLAVLPACGSQRISDYLAEHCSLCSSTTDETGTTAAPGEDTSSSGSDETTLESPETTGTGTTEASTSTPEETGTMQGSTGEPTGECGNGVLEPFGLEPEECDDGNLDPLDGCSDTCALDRGAFVTSVLYNGAGIESLKIADALCFNRADDQGLSDALKYRAWLSNSTTDARDRFKRGRGRLVMMNGLVLAASWDALLSGALENNFEVTEKSETYHGGVWTGTQPDGTAVPGSQHCDDWSNGWFMTTGHYGYSDRTTPEWTFAQDSDQPSPCNSDYALYCIQSL
ncbi:MAG TPA: hypothetical protein VGB85_13895 [Nannocystis sp.]